MANKESVVEKAFVLEIKNSGGKALKLNCIGFRFMPDRMCLFPGGYLCFVEIKTIEGKLSKGQVFRIRWLTKWEFDVFVVYGKENIKEVIDVINFRRNTKSKR